jgi:hypothetical protein
MCSICRKRKQKSNRRRGIQRKEQARISRLENKPTKDELQRHIQARTRELGEQELREARQENATGIL